MNEWIVVGVLVALVGLRVMMVGMLVLFIIRPVRGCPACFRDTFPLRKWWLRWITFRMEWRWCPSCGWEGLARRMPAGARAGPGPRIPADAEDPERAGG